MQRQLSFRLNQFTYYRLAVFGSRFTDYLNRVFVPDDASCVRLSLRIGKFQPQRRILKSR